MSILDGMAQSQEEIEAAVALALPAVQEMYRGLDLNPDLKSTLELLGQGLSLAQIYGISDEERDALLWKGCSLIKAGELEKARIWLLGLYKLEPFDSRVIYALGSIFQMKGEIDKAAKLYVYSIGLDVHNADGHLRLAECLLSAREYEAALEHFQFARNNCALDETQPEASYADKMIEHTKERLATSAKV